MPAAGSEHGAIAVTIALVITPFVKAHGLGVVFGTDTAFKIASDPDTVRATDLAFVRRERLPEGGIPGDTGRVLQTWPSRSSHLMRHTSKLKRRRMTG